MAKHAKKLMFASVFTAVAGMAALPSAAFALGSGTQGSGQTEAVMNSVETERVPGNVALVRGDMSEAIATLEAARRAEGNDPAILINLGQAYARSGDRDMARSLFIRARDSRRDYDMMLSSGQVVSSRDAAVAALNWLDGAAATAQLRR